MMRKSWNWKCGIPNRAPSPKIAEKRLLRANVRHHQES